MATVHSGEKPFKCTACNSSFVQKYEMKVHIAAVHEGKKPFKCKICDKGFARKAELKAHIVKVHKKYYWEIHMKACKSPIPKEDEHKKCSYCSVEVHWRGHFKHEEKCAKKFGFEFHRRPT